MGTRGVWTVTRGILILDGEEQAFVLVVFLDFRAVWRYVTGHQGQHHGVLYHTGV